MLKLYPILLIFFEHSVTTLYCTRMRYSIQFKSKQLSVSLYIEMQTYKNVATFHLFSALSMIGVSDDSNIFRQIIQVHLWSYLLI